MHLCMWQEDWSGLPKSVPFMLDGKLLPWLASATHIGHELHESGSMDLDTKMKKQSSLANLLRSERPSTLLAEWRY